MLLRCSHGPLASLSNARRKPAHLVRALPALLSSQSARQYASLEPGVSHDIGIVGGGITGLAAAYYLTQRLPRAKITIYETSDRIGGWLQSKRVPLQGGSVLFEAGPRTLRVAQNNASALLATRLIQELDLKKETIFTSKLSPAHRSRFMYYPDHLVQMPHPSLGVFNILALYLREPIFKSSAWSMIKEIFVSQRDPGVQDESVGDFISRRFSRDVAERLFSGFMHGVYAGDIWKLSAKSLLSTLWNAEAQAGSVLKGMSQTPTSSKSDGTALVVANTTQREAALIKECTTAYWDPALASLLSRASVYTFREGLGQLTDTLARKLYESGSVTFKTSTAVKCIKASNDGSHDLSMETIHEGDHGVQEHSHIVPTLSPNHLSQVIDGSQDLTNALGSIPSVTVMTVNFYFASHSSPNNPGSPLHPTGFGYLIPAATPFDQNPERALGVVFDDAYSPSPKYFRPDKWSKEDLDKLGDLCHATGLDPYVNDFSWTNFPNKPVMQDEGDSLGGSKLTVMLGGHWWDGWPQHPSEEEGLQMAKSVLQRHLGITEEPLAYQVNLQKNCIPQYTVGHETRLKKAHNELWRLYRGRLLVAGNWMSGVGVNDCIRSAWEVAESISTGREATGLEEVGNAKRFTARITTDGRVERVED
ncbi:Protoporphyrinogen oxidase [Polychaeton citri CBS 116435]|uniref:Protoporphyrinogen oxidase n=1 Tax=Polychaeton citri CBS 116435 TaxID=1314669 RepID=A0A9P4QG39_9PEZI|nr:Protoporphyrinogen oxidase [Polychaeton citri CBS 116435]